MLDWQSPRAQAVGIVTAAAVLCAAYLPTLAAPFDFNDDGCLVYPTGGGVRLGSGELAARVWAKTTGEFSAKGPFRPVTWFHWEWKAQLLGPQPFAYRVLRLTWAVVAAALLLWLLAELRIPPPAAVITAAAAMWNPYRNEVWVGLGLTESFGTPYALLALVCAARAGRAAGASRWDLLGAAAALAALGCKNTFAVVVPVQVLLRLGVADMPLSLALRRHGARAALLGLTLLLPVGHFVAYRLHQPADGYQLTTLSAAQAWRAVKSVLRGGGLDYLGAGAACLGGFVWWSRRRSAAGSGVGLDRNLWTVLAAGTLLAVLGAGIYLPIAGTSGRYSIPGAWGLDLLLAVLVTVALRLPRTRFRTAGFAVLGLGLAAGLADHLVRQDKFAARARMLWGALEYVEGHVAPGRPVAFLGTTQPRSSADLSWAEGVHFGWHLQGRGRSVSLANLDPSREGVPAGASLAVTGGPVAPPTGSSWHLARTVTVPYCLGLRTYQCFVWSSPGGPPGG